MAKNSLLISQNSIEQKILLIRGHRVMFDRDLAMLYGVSTKALNQAVKRNSERFPEDFMPQLTKHEMKNWRSQFVTSNSSKMGLRRRPYAFSENGVAMLSSVLRSPAAIQANIRIMRTFTYLREMAQSQKKIWEKIEAMERNYDKQFKIVFDALRQLLEPPVKSKKPIGFYP